MTTSPEVPFDLEFGDGFDCTDPGAGSWPTRGAVGEAAADLAGVVEPARSRQGRRIPRRRVLDDFETCSQSRDFTRSSDVVVASQRLCDAVCQRHTGRRGSTRTPADLRFKTLPESYYVLVQQRFAEVRDPTVGPGKRRSDDV